MSDLLTPTGGSNLTFKVSFDLFISNDYLGTEHQWCEDPIESAPFIRDRAPMVQRTLLNLLRLLLGTEHRWCRGPY